MVRRLPVIREPAEDPDAVVRPRSRWIAIGGAFAVILWIPLVAVTMPLGAALAARLGSTSRQALATGAGTSGSVVMALLSAGPPLVSFFIAAGSSGALVVRFGTNTRPPDGAAAGALGGALAAALAWTVGRDLPTIAAAAALCLLTGMGLLGGYAGGAWGARKR